MPDTLSLSPSQLLFDPDNPRLPPDIGRDQNKIFRYLVDEIGIEDLLSSMSATGFIVADPIIVKLAADIDASPAQYYSIEGNRRLAAIKTLLGHTINDGKSEQASPAMEPAVALTFQYIPVQLDWNPKELEAYLGYKHVTSTREWSPEAKARFVQKSANRDFSDNNLRTFARQFGTTLPTLKRWLIALVVLDQAASNAVFDPKRTNNKRYFGTFYTLLGSSRIREFIGLNSETNLDVNPVPADKIVELGELVQWTIGTQSNPPIVNSRMQSKFETVLSSPRALDYFRTKHDLDGALMYTEFNAGHIAGQFRAATFSIEDTFRQLYDVRSHDGVIEAFAGLKNSIAAASRIMDGS